MLTKNGESISNIEIFREVDTTPADQQKGKKDLQNMMQIA
jgi:hypothetical protein